MVIGIVMLVAGYFFIIFKEWFFIGFSILLIGIFIELYLLWENNQRTISYLEGIGYKIDKRLSPLNSKEIEDERLNHITKHYEDEDLEFLEFLSKISKEKILLR